MWVPSIGRYLAWVACGHRHYNNPPSGTSESLHKFIMTSSKSCSYSLRCCFLSCMQQGTRLNDFENVCFVSTDAFASIPIYCPGLCYHKLGLTGSNHSIQSQKPITIASRALTTTCRRPAELPGPNTPPATSIPPVNPKPVKGSTTANVPPTPAEQAAALSQKGGVTGTYTAYGATEKLYKDCARQADYRIPQAGKDDAEVPKTEDGEDLGVGEGWWHTGIPSCGNRAFN